MKVINVDNNDRNSDWIKFIKDDNEQEILTEKDLNIKKDSTKKFRFKIGDFLEKTDHKGIGTIVKISDNKAVIQYASGDTSVWDLNDLRESFTKVGKLSVDKAFEKAQTLQRGRVLDQESYNMIINRMANSDIYPFVIKLINVGVKVV